jgi:Reverse transcriptase (RNA-dependent DNA polymerase)
VNWVLDVDIRGFFDNMSHEWTMKFVEHRVADSRIDGQWSETKVGTPQGAVASPMLANVYLHYVFDPWVESFRKPANRAGTGSSGTGAAVVRCRCRQRTGAYQGGHQAGRLFTGFSN